MSPLQLAARIVDRSSPENPADLVLRQTLFRRRSLPPSDAAWVSRAVFSFFRWQRWLADDLPIEARIEDGLRLAARFASRPEEFPEAELVQRCVPDWTAAHLQVGADFAKSLQAEPVLWLRSRPEFTEELFRRLPTLEPGPFADSYRYLGREDLFHDRGFQAGQFEIQDIASQAVGRICAPRPGEVWWDACAGEGGKTLHLSALMGGKSLIWASDRAAWRLDRLRQRAARAKCFNYRAVAWDGSERPPTKTRFDGVLLDAPCSGLGTWGRNPHARWTTSVRDVEELAAIQARLLRHVADSLKPGGRLIYAVCTLSHAETTAVADAFTEERSDFDTLAVVNPFQPDDPPVTQMHLWPQDTGGNGMFVAAWRRL
jgi:16S rRNA (cytosine967-C5)-methyltransferase